MLLVSAAIGIYYAFAGGGQQTSKDFLMGGRRMSAVPVSLSLTASFMSAVTILGSPSEVYRFGAMYIIFAITYFFVVLISAEVFLPVFYKLGITSTYEVRAKVGCGGRAGGAAGSWESFPGGDSRHHGDLAPCRVHHSSSPPPAPVPLGKRCPASGCRVTGFDLWGVVAATGVVCTFYCTLGGLKAVVWTDVFQAGIMLAGYTSVIIQAAVIQGGINTIFNDAYNGGRLNIWNFNPNPLQRHTFWTIIIGGTFTWTTIYGVNQSQVQRYISCKSRFQAKLSLYINLLGLWAILICSVICGLALYSRYQDCDPWTAKKVSAPDQLMPYLVLDILQDYPGLPGLFVACVYSGTL
ncbi:PREDICTED: sodium-coupled monocarboxylate transporter 1-like, partial [Galeopterus variegatus]|uniref:Sodium-coupled monocarboxylate transporter 1-like n=1 Tax=Galeopterus variegatus TaxID=482537 RepID=A0ABM0RGI4_GALVR